MRNETQRFVLNDKWTVIYNKSMAFKWKWMAHFQVEKTGKNAHKNLSVDDFRWKRSSNLNTFVYVRCDVILVNLSNFMLHSNV